MIPAIDDFLKKRVIRGKKFKDFSARQEPIRAIMKSIKEDVEGEKGNKK